MKTLYLEKIIMFSKKTEREVTNESEVMNESVRGTN
jgi:hypothetical protein